MIRLLAATIILALVLAACGDDDTTTSVVDDAPLQSYFGKLDSVSATSVAAVERAMSTKVPFNELPNEQAVAALTSFRDDLASIEPPPTAKRAHEEFLASYDGFLTYANESQGGELTEQEFDAESTAVIGVFARLYAACQALLAVAEENGIDTALECPDEESLSATP